MKLYNIVKVYTSTVGTGTVSLGSAVPSFITFATAGVVSGSTVSYAIEDGTNREVGTGVYTSGAETLTRSVVTSTNSNNAIALSGNAVVFITGLAADLSSDTANVASTLILRDASGNFAAGSAALVSAVVPLVVGGTGTTSPLTLRSTSGVGTTGADIIFQAGNNGATEVMRVQNGGNVGIGTPTPSSRLHVLTAGATAANEVARFQGGTNLANFRNYVSFYSTNPNFWWELSNEDSAGAGSTNGLAFRERSSSDPSLVRMYLASGGNVGIGTANPEYQTQVNGSGQITAALTDAGNKGGSILIADTGAAAGNGGSLLFAAAVTNGFVPGCAIKSLLVSGNANGRSDLAFSTRNAVSDTSLTERMRILSTGEVGIGRTPAYKLDVSAVVSRSGDTGVNSYLQLGANATDLNNYLIGCESGSFAFYQGRYGGVTTERMRIDSSGRVGIGTAIPATSAAVDITSTTGALIVPRMTTTQRNALTAVNGMIIYNTTDNQMQGYINGAWAAM